MPPTMPTAGVRRIPHKVRCRRPSQVTGLAEFLHKPIEDYTSRLGQMRPREQPALLGRQDHRRTFPAGGKPPACHLGGRHAGGVAPAGDRQVVYFCEVPLAVMDDRRGRLWPLHQALRKGLAAADSLGGKGVTA